MIIRLNRTMPVVAALVFIAHSVAAFAATSAGTPGLIDAFNVESNVHAELSAGNFSQPAQQTLNILVKKGIANLAAAGETTLASQLESEWNSGLSDYLPNHVVVDQTASASLGFITVLDIGDHDPLSPWLAKFHDTLSAKTMGIIDGFQVVHDIFTMNYALGVVLHPKANSWKSASATSQENEWEYRKHFIPMANIISYWATLETCNYVTKAKAPALARLCKPAATKLEFYMGRYWAPKMSDFVYEKANGIRASKKNRSSFADAPDFVISEADFEKDVMASAN
jgi:hypothetical protein